ncbi:hypothetical protein QYM36_002234 [Artemia franciscana]|uniref:Uncharacterized protein n=1 Tax=Artemia franciscana TaxID=6661 RepID=A0AA88I8I1_ARTSF|nr:hypothetical protein QYM36_002234 [Artemia franciscana]
MVVRINLSPPDIPGQANAVFGEQLPIFAQALGSTLSKSLLPERLSFIQKEEKAGLVAKFGVPKIPVPMKILSLLTFVAVSFLTVIIVVVSSTSLVFFNVANIFPVIFPGSRNYKKKKNNRSNTMANKSRKGKYGKYGKPTKLDENEGSLGALKIQLPQLYDDEDVPVTITYGYDRHVMSPEQYSAFLDALADRYYEMHEDEYGFEEEEDDKKKKNKKHKYKDDYYDDVVEFVSYDKK